MKDFNAGAFHLQDVPPKWIAEAAESIIWLLFLESAAFGCEFGASLYRDIESDERRLTS